VVTAEGEIDELCPRLAVGAEDQEPHACLHKMDRTAPSCVNGKQRLLSNVRSHAALFERASRLSPCRRCRGASRTTTCSRW
jgi:hypothetical protein